MLRTSTLTGEILRRIRSTQRAKAYFARAPDGSRGVSEWRVLRGPTQQHRRKISRSRLKEHAWSLLRYIERMIDNSFVLRVNFQTELIWQRGLSFALVGAGFFVGSACFA